MKLPIERSEFAQQTNLHNSAVTKANHQKFEVITAKEIAKCKMFLHLYAFEHLIRGNQPEFSLVWPGLWKYHPRKKEDFSPISESCLMGVF